MTSLRSHEGYLFIDNSNSPGVSDATVLSQGLPAGSGKGIFEAATYTCSHCNAIVVIEPKRTRERGFCKGCSQCICDACNVIRAIDFKCRSFKHMIDEMQEADLKRAASSDAAPSILLPGN